MEENFVEPSLFIQHQCFIALLFSFVFQKLMKTIILSYTRQWMSGKTDILFFGEAK